MFAFLLSLFFTNSLAAILLWGFRLLVLIPLNLEIFDVVVYAVLIAPVLRTMMRSAFSAKDETFLGIAPRMDDPLLNCLVFGIALIVSGKDYGAFEAILASAGSVLGYWASVALLSAIRERLELSGMQTSFKSGPAILLSAGLMAMAFSGLDSVVRSGLAR
jgi:electron transport complex protein RnfA